MPVIDAKCVCGSSSSYHTHTLLSDSEVNISHFLEVIEMLELMDFCEDIRSNCAQLTTLPLVHVFDVD